jgi:hypothetical protein
MHAWAWRKVRDARNIENHKITDIGWESQNGYSYSEYTEEPATCQLDINYIDPDDLWMGEPRSGTLIVDFTESGGESFVAVLAEVLAVYEELFGRQP